MIAKEKVPSWEEIYNEIGKGSIELRSFDGSVLFDLFYYQKYTCAYTNNGIQQTISLGGTTSYALYYGVPTEIASLKGYTYGNDFANSYMFHCPIGSNIVTLNCLDCDANLKSTNGVHLSGSFVGFMDYSNDRVLNWHGVGVSYDR